MATSAWKKEGQVSTTPEAPGSYGGWVKGRKAPRKTPKTDQQKKIAAAGRAVGKECKGKEGSEFRTCRHEVLDKLF